MIWLLHELLVQRNTNGFDSNFLSFDKKIKKIVFVYLENSKEKYICNTALSVIVSNEVKKKKRKIHGRKREISSRKGFY